MLHLRRVIKHALGSETGRKGDAYAYLSLLYNVIRYFKGHFTHLLLIRQLFSLYTALVSKTPIGGQHRRLTLVTRKRISKLHPCTTLPFYACELQAIPAFGARSMLGVSLPH
jgi:hypothetical protein